jgi:energy-coupling factor transport system substrate-specific component
MKRTMTAVIYALGALIGLLAFLYPLLLPGLWRRLGLSVASIAAESAHQEDAPLLTVILLVLCLLVLLMELQGQAVSAKVVAALGVMVAVIAVLRVVELAVPGPGGFSLVFAPIILAGYVFGARFGFLLGALALLVSALITGGVGPWMPYQMFAAGWVGMTAGWLPHPSRPRLQVTLLATFSFAWGLLFGAIMNLYFWPFVADGAATSWQPGISLGDGLHRYVAFYLATSSIWDVGRAFGNAAIIVALGMPTVTALLRFRERFEFRVA